MIKFEDNTQISEFGDHELWVTPIRITTVGDEQLIQELRKEVAQGFGDFTQGFNLYNNKTPAIAELKRLITDEVNSYWEKYTDVEYLLEPERAWVALTEMTVGNPPHAHGFSQVVSVFYMQADTPDCGDIVLYDPRGGVNWPGGVEDYQITCTHKRITPVTGMLLIHPGYVMHSVDHNRSPIMRVSIASNYMRGANRSVR